MKCVALFLGCIHELNCQNFYVLVMSCHQNVSAHCSHSETQTERSATILTITHYQSERRISHWNWHILLTYKWAKRCKILCAQESKSWKYLVLAPMTTSYITWHFETNNSLFIVSLVYGLCGLCIFPNNHFYWEWLWKSSYRLALPLLLLKKLRGFLGLGFVLNADFLVCNSILFGMFIFRFHSCVSDRPWVLIRHWLWCFYTEDRWQGFCVFQE